MKIDEPRHYDETEIPMPGYLPTAYDIAKFERENDEIPVDELAQAFVSEFKRAEREQLLFDMVKFDIERVRSYRLRATETREARMAYYEQHHERDEQDLQKQRAARRAAVEVERERLVSTIRERIELEITEKLLASSFTGRNGKKVRWGKATVEDHFACVEYLLSQAGANVGRANKHEAAIELLNERGALNLGEVYASMAIATS